MENLWRQWNLDRVTVSKSLKCFRTNGCRKWRNRFTIEKFVVLAECFQQEISADIEENLANQGEFLRWGTSCIYLSLSNKWKSCHGAVNSRPCNLRKALEKYFRVHWNYKQLRVEERNSMPNCEVYFPLFSQTIHTISKIFSHCCLLKK